MEIAAAAIAAVGAVVSAVFAAYARIWTRDVARIESKVDGESRDRAELEAELWKQLRQLPDEYPTRREFDVFVGLMADLKSDVKDLRTELKSDTETILQAIRDAR